MSHTIIISITILSATIGGTLWAALLYRNKLSFISSHRLILLVFIVAVGCRITFVMLTPTFYAPDEQPHFNYVKYLYENRSFPIQMSQTGAKTKDWEYYQPPLYYLASVPIYWLANTLIEHEGNFFLVRAIRSLSIVFWGINMVFTLKILENLQINDQFIRVFVVSMVCLLPTYTFLSSSINNDNLLIMIGGVILYLLSNTPSLGKTLLIGGLLGLALLTKLTAVVYICAIAGVLGTQVVRKSLSLSTASLHFFVIVFLAAVLFSPWALRNLYVYGNVYPEEVANVPAQWQSTYDAFLVTQRKIKDTFWSVSGIYNNIRFLPAIGVYLTYLALIGFMYGLLAKSRSFYECLHGKSRNFLIGTAVAIVANIVLALRFGMLYDQGQGRFLFPLLIPISLLMGIGLKSLGIANRSKSIYVHTVGFFVVYNFAFIAYSLGYFARIWMRSFS